MTLLAAQWGRAIAVQRCMVLTLPSVAALTWVAGCTGVWIFGIFLGQMGLIAAETTTFEVSGALHLLVHVCVRALVK